jgi:hypothetical protein
MNIASSDTGKCPIDELILYKDSGATETIFKGVPSNYKFSISNDNKGINNYFMKFGSKVNTNKS